MSTRKNAPSPTAAPLPEKTQDRYAPGKGVREAEPASTKETGQPDPEVKKLRQDVLGLSQEELASQLGIKRISVLQWESGRTKPSNEMYVKLAKLATGRKGGNAIHFWEKAGVDLEALGGLIPEVAATLKEFEKKRRAPAADVVNVPLLKSEYSEFIARPSSAPAKAIERWVPWPSESVRQLSATCCFWGPVEFGLQLLVPGRQILLLDNSVVDPSKLTGEMILAQATKPNDFYPVGRCYTGWLHRIDLEKLEQAGSLREVIVLNGVPPQWWEAAQEWTRLEKPGTVIRGVGGWRVLARVIGQTSYKLDEAIDAGEAKR